MTTKLEARLKKAIDRTRIVWYIVMFIAGWFTATQLEPWCLLLLFPFAFISYAFLLYMTVNILAHTTPPEELAEAEAENAKARAERAKFEVVENIAMRQAAGEHIPADKVMKALVDAGITEIARVQETGPVIGTYRDKPIYEYILVQMPKRDGIDKMTYHGPANIVDGIAQIPEIPGMIFACVENILYAKEVPEQQK